MSTTALRNLAIIAGSVAGNKITVEEGFEETADLIDAINNNGGTHTPSGTIVLNLDAITMYQSTYFIVGDFCIVMGKFDADTTAGGSATVFRQTIPVNSNFSIDYHASGVAVGWFTGTVSSSVAIHAETDPNFPNRVKFNWKTAATNNNAYFYIYAYRIIP